MNRRWEYDRLGRHPGLMTDLYHPDSAYVAWRAGLTGETTFDLYTRTAPFGGAYLLTAGLELALEFVRTFRFTEEDLRFLSQVRDYDPAFLDYLGTLRFRGEIAALPEGTVAFPNEPLVRVTAPFPEALLLESGILSAVNPSTLLATKAARVVWAARGRPVAEFALRRALEPFTVTRSAFIGGCQSTSFVAGAHEYRLRATGTIPHALVQLFETERQAFEAVAACYSRYTLLLDTYDVQHAARSAVAVARQAEREHGHLLTAVRLDSGDLAADSKMVRAILDEAGLSAVRIVASGDLDEYRIVELLEAGACIDAFGVGTSLGVAAGSPAHGVPGGSLGGVYKAVWYADPRGGERPMLKTGDPAKATWPGRKEIYRRTDHQADLLALVDEPAPDGALRLMRAVVVGGEIVPGSLPPLSEIWETARASLAALPVAYQALHQPPPYPVDSAQRCRRCGGPPSRPR